jgi:hypothetical protein
VDVVKKYAGTPKELQKEIGEIDAVCKVVQTLALENKNFPLPQPLWKQLNQNVKLCGEFLVKYEDANPAQRLMHMSRAADRLEKVRRAKNDMMIVRSIIQFVVLKGQGVDVEAALKKLVEQLESLETELRSNIPNQSSASSAPTGPSFGMQFDSSPVHGGTFNQGSTIAYSTTQPSGPPNRNN